MDSPPNVHALWQLTRELLELGAEIRPNYGSKDPFGSYSRYLLMTFSSSLA